MHARFRIYRLDDDWRTLSIMHEESDAHETELANEIGAETINGLTIM